MRKLQSMDGFTLLEVLIATAIIAMVCGIGLSMTVSGLNASNNVMARSDIQERAIFVVNYIAKELMLSSWKTITPTYSAPNSSNFISYQKIASYNMETNQYQMGATNKFELKTVDGKLCVLFNDKVFASGVSTFAKGETSATGDENGNGLKNEAGLCFEKIGNQSIVIRLTLEKMVKNKLIQEYAETLVHVRQP